MPALPWLIHFPDDDATVLESGRAAPEAGEEILAGWVVTDRRAAAGASKRNFDLEIWVTAKQRRRPIRQRTDRP